MKKAENLKTKLKIHNKQFYIIDSRFYKGKILEDFNTISINEYTLLVYHKSIVANILPNFTIILGLLLAEYKNFNEAYYQSGRFIIIHKGNLSLDATGSLGVFYSNELLKGINVASGIICSSSLSLLSELSGNKIEGLDLNKRTINWDPSPMSRVENFTRLYIDQEIDLENLKIIHKKRSIFIKSKNIKNLSEELGDYFLSRLEYLKALNRPIYLALTAGSDSRLLLAALVRSEIKFIAYTLDLETEASLRDCSIASKLCDIYGITHYIFKRNGKNINNYKTYIRHTAGAGGDKAFKYVKGDYYNKIPSNAILLHGGAFEIGQRFYESKLSGVDFSDPIQAVNQIENEFYDKLDHLSKTNLENWIRYRNQNPILNVDWIDVFYIDQRRAAWGASNRQAEDIFEFDWLVLANSWYVIERLLSPDVNDRRNNVLQKMTSEYLLPGITSVVPINPVTKKIKFRLFISFMIPKKLKPIILKLLREI